MTTDTPTETQTPVSTSTPTYTQSGGPTFTTDTETPTETATPTSILTTTPTDTPTDTPTNTPNGEVTGTPTPAATARSSDTPTQAIATNTPTPTHPHLPLPQCYFSAGPMLSPDGESATLAWSTNEPTLAEVRSPDGSFGTLQNSQKALDHSFTIPQLTTNTNYEFIAKITCDDGNSLERRGAFQTQPANPPTILEGPSVPYFSIKPDKAVILWRTDKPTDSSILFGDRPLFATFAMEQEHATLVDQLTPDTDYTYTVRGTDAQGNQVSADVSFRTAPFQGDSRPLILEGPRVDSLDLSANHALIRWKTDEATSSELLITPPGQPAQLFAAKGLALDHSIRIDALTPGTTYQALVRSTDLDGNTVESAAFAFTTPPAPSEARPSLTSPVSVTYVSNDRMVLEWANDLPATAQLLLKANTAGRPQGRGIWIQSSLTQNPQARVLDLAPDTSYNYDLLLTSSDGTQAQLTGQALRTAPDSTPPEITGAHVAYSGPDRLLVEWNTDEASDSSAELLVGKSSTGYVLRDEAPVTHHRLDLTRLGSLGGPFTVRVRSCNPSALCAQPMDLAAALQSADHQPPGLTQALKLEEVTQTTATLSWSTDEPSASTLRFSPSGRGQAESLRSDSRLLTEHRMVVTQLEPATCYNLALDAQDPAGNQATLSTSFGLCTSSSVGASSGAWSLALAASLGLLAFAAQRRRPSRARIR